MSAHWQDKPDGPGFWWFRQLGWESFWPVELQLESGELFAPANQHGWQAPRYMCNFDGHWSRAFTPDETEALIEYAAASAMAVHMDNSDDATEIWERLPSSIQTRINNHEKRMAESAGVEL